MYEDIKRYLRVVSVIRRQCTSGQILVYVLARFHTGTNTRTEKRIRPCTMLCVFAYVTSLYRAQVRIHVSEQDHGVSEKLNVRRIRRVIA